MESISTQTSDTEANKQPEPSKNEEKADNHKWVVIDGDKYHTIYARIDDPQTAQSETQEPLDLNFPRDSNFDEFINTSSTVVRKHKSTDDIEFNEVASINNLKQHRHDIRMVHKNVKPMSFWELASNLINLCCVFCPPCPFPTQIIRNAAFHPPPRNQNYMLIENRNGNKLKNARVAMECPSVGFTSKFAPKNIERDGKPKISVFFIYEIYFFELFF
uniref:Uncharacterized protein n=1 Tax=Acrobeloides nanus TaxID=290746 RepID=A0A914CQZ9_9BILA